MSASEAATTDSTRTGSMFLWKGRRDGARSPTPYPEKHFVRWSSEEILTARIHGAPCGSDRLDSADPSPPYKGKDFDLELTNKSSLRRPRHAPFLNFRGKYKGKLEVEESEAELEDIELRFLLLIISSR
ncbi:hypothetical protein OSTOST_17883 [Ostertagia ostertagi]